ncbi:MAG: iron-containing alcohol dehydrogenase, partial [Mangrovibacterium sp.]
NLGIEANGGNEELAAAAIVAVRNWIESMGISLRLSTLNIPENSLEEIAASALKVQRLLRNNVREVGFDDALAIYKKAY